MKSNDFFPEINTPKRINKKEYSHLSLEERKKIKKYIDKDLSYSKMGKLLGRYPCTINKEIKRNGGKEIYDPIKANELHEKFKSSKNPYNSFLKCVSIGDFMKDLTQKINNLEMQVEILIKQIRQIKGKND